MAFPFTHYACFASTDQARRGDIAAEVGARLGCRKVGLQLIKATAHEIELDVPEDKYDTTPLPPLPRYTPSHATAPLVTQVRDDAAPPYHATPGT